MYVCMYVCMYVFDSMLVLDMRMYEFIPFVPGLAFAVILQMVIQFIRRDFCHRAAERHARAAHLAMGALQKDKQMTPYRRHMYVYVLRL